MPSKLLLLAGAVLGCSSLTGGVVRPPGNGVETAQGLPYYLTQPSFRIEQKTLHAGKPALPVNAVVIDAVPDPERHFEVGMHSGLFSSDSFSLEIAESGSLAAVSGNSTDRTAKVVAELTKLAAEVAKTVALFSMPAKGVAGVIEYAHVKGVIDDAQRTAADKAHRVLTENLAAKEPLDEAQLRVWKAVSKIMRKALVEGHTVQKVAADGTVKQEVVLESIETMFATLDAAQAKPEPAVGEIETLEKAIRSQAGRVNTLDEFGQKLAAAAAPPATTQVANLQKAFDRALAEFVRKPDDRRRKDDLEAAARALSAARARVLAATEEVDPQALAERREALLEYLQRAIPNNPTSSRSTAYQQLAGEFAKVRASIQSIGAPKAAASGTAKPLATETTHRIDDRVFVDRRDTRPDAATLNQRMALAQARIRFAKANAVVIVYPE